MEMDLSGVDLMQLFTRQFELSKVSPGEHVIVLSEPSSRSDYVAAAFGAAKQLGAHVASVVTPSGTPIPEPATHTGSGPGLQSVLDNRVVQGALKAADMVVDLTHEGFVHAPIQSEILAEGTRILFVCDAPDVLARNMPTVEDTERVEAARDLIKQSSVMKVTSVAGTDLTIDLIDSHPGFQKGFVDKPGKWDHWPSTMVTCWPMTSNGTIVLTAGDILLPFKEYVSTDIFLTVVDGRIEGISGGPDASRLQQFFDDSDDQWARSLSHMGWGLMHTANWFATAMYSKHEIMGMDARAFAGNFLWSTGPHPFLGHESFAHLDIAMRGCSIDVDDTAVTKDGRLV
jgi:2,5-dihydroxypyridine 5,6-dioxygenase